MALSGKTTRNILANYLGQGWAGLMAVAFLPVYVGRLGMEAYGLIGFFAAMHSLLAILDLGATPTVIREMARLTAGQCDARSIRQLLRSFEWVCFGVSAVIAAAIWLAAPHLAEFWVRPDQLSVNTVADAIALMAFVLALRCCEGIYRGTLIGLERQVLYNSANAAMATLRYGGAVLVLQYSPSIEAFFLWQIAVSILTLMVLVGAAYLILPAAKVPAGFSATALTDVWRFSLGMTAITGLSMLTVNLDKLLLSAQLPLEAFGHYALASTAASVLYMAVVPITQATFPQMVGHVGRSEAGRLEAAYRWSSRWVVTIVGPAALLLAAFSAEIIYVWSGDRQLAAHISPILSVLALSALSNCISHVPFNLQLARGTPRLLIVANAFLVILAVAILPTVGATYGPVGAALAWLALNAVHALAIVGVAHGNLAPVVRRLWAYQDVAAPMGGALVAIGLADQLQAKYPSGGRLELAAFLLLTGIGATIAATRLAKLAWAGAPVQPPE